MSVQKRANLHEKAVQAVARGDVPQRAARPRKAPQRLVQPTYQAPLVNAKVWKRAKQILDGPGGFTRWEVRSENEVIVR